MSAWSKVEGCCRQARKDGWRYCIQWIDSCCIDKSSSAELSEAINSMFEWYRRAEVCYAYLSDLDSTNRYQSSIESYVKRSAWFTRGWTLQELLAPQWVEFYDIRWQELGTKSSLAPLIESITGITHLFSWSEATIAQKMSWASLRQTTRVEDQAYCLLGIFGVHMSPLYGEGMNAFYRLQMEIIGQSDDESIFAWEGRSNVTTGLLATSPKQFQYSGDIEFNNECIQRQPYSMTNQGLRLEFDLVELATPRTSGSRREFLAPLNCMRGPDEKQVAIRISPKLALHSQWPHDARSWFRQGKLEKAAFYGHELIKTTIFAQKIQPNSVFSRPQCVVVKLSTPRDPPFAVRNWLSTGSLATWSRNCTEASEEQVLTSFYKGDEMAALIYRDETQVSFAMILGSNRFVFWIDIIVGREQLQRLEASPNEFLTSLARPETSRGGGDRIAKKLTDGRVVSAMLKKELHSATYRFNVDVAISVAGKVRPGELEFARFHKGVLELDGAFGW